LTGTVTPAAPVAARDQVIVVTNATVIEQPELAAD